MCVCVCVCVCVCLCVCALFTFEFCRVFLHWPAWPAVRQRRPFSCVTAQNIRVTAQRVATQTRLKKKKKKMDTLIEAVTARVLQNVQTIFFFFF